LSGHIKQRAAQREIEMDIIDCGFEETNPHNQHSENELEVLRYWIFELGLEEGILERMSDGIDAVVNYLMEEAFDFNEAEKVYEFYSV
jgi:hypothetical protein